MYYFYILYSKSLDRFYLGHTSDLKSRLNRHNTNHKGYTGRTHDLKIILTEPYTSKYQVHKRELQVKAWKSRASIQELISNNQEEH